MTSTNQAVRDIPLGEGGNIEDLLQVTPYVKALENFINDCSTPMTIAIQGDWGTGKTSMMRLLEKSLEVKHFTVWFNTWQYSQFSLGDAISMAFISNVANEIAPDSLRKALEEHLAPFFGKIVPFALRLGVSIGTAGLSNAIAGTGEGKTDANLSQGYPSALEAVQQIGGLKKKMKEAVDARLKEQKDKEKKDTDRVIIFVDDLDRINPERAVELLETIKMFMDVPGVVFVLALDYAVVKRGLRKRFDTDESDLGGRSFFDKIIQLPFTMPTANYKISEYLKALLTQVGFQYNDNDLQIYENLIKHSIGFNPRSAKRLINVIRIHNLVEQAKTNELQIQNLPTDPKVLVYKNRVLFGLVCLQTAFEPAFHVLRNNLSKNTIEDWRNGNFDSITQSSEGRVAELFSEKKAWKFQSFVAALCEAVDKDENGGIDENEISELAGVMKTLAITSITDTAQDTGGLPDYFSLGKMTAGAVLSSVEGSGEDLLSKIALYNNNNRSTRWVRGLLVANLNGTIEDVVPGYKEFGAKDFIENQSLSFIRTNNLYKILQMLLNNKPKIENIRNICEEKHGKTLVKKIWSELETL